MGIGDFLSDAWSSITEAYDDFKQGLSDWEAYARVEKAIERELVHSIFGPSKLNKRDGIKTDLDENVKGIASEIKAGLTSVTSQLDEDIKGKFSKAIQTTMKEKNNQWDNL